MNTILEYIPSRVTSLAAALAVLFTVAHPTMVCAAPPLEPLPAPYFCFDAQSPSIQAGFVGPADVLALGDEHPQRVIFGWQLGLPDPNDSLTGLSSPHSLLIPNQPFVILFSVDRATVGLAPPDPGLVAAGVPYNVLDQAWRGQAAGDQFISTTVFTLPGGPLHAERSTPHNGTLGRNNFDEGGTDFQAAPATSASSAPVAESQDNVICTSYLPSSTRQIVQVYFTVNADSPSLPFLSGTSFPSGASIFFNYNPQTGGVTEMYAPFYALGLQPTDNIDAVMVFDMNMDGIYNPGDAVLFSLAPYSPSLFLLFEASPVGAAADVFIARPGFPTTAFANAEQFGLGAPSDNIDALELFPSTDPMFRATRSGIRALRGDLNCDDLLNSFDIDPFVLALTDPPAYYAAFPGCDVIRADTNHDGLINAFDIDPFVLLLTGGPDSR